MSLGLGTAVHGVVLWRGNDFEVFRVVALEAFDEFNRQASRQIRIFAVGFLPAAPARIAKEDDGGAPERQAFVARSLSVAKRLVLCRPRFSRDHIRNLVHQVCVPGRSQTDRLRKDGGVAGARDSVQGFVPPIVRRNIEPHDRRRRIHHLRDFFLQRHARKQIVNALLDGQRWILVRR